MTKDYSPMDFRLGAVVMTRNIARDEVFGHVEGFARNSSGELILSVKWEDGEVRSIHPNNVTLDPAEWPEPWSEAKTLAKMRAKEEARRRA